VPKPRVRRPKSPVKSETALDRLKARCPHGPPFCILILDEETVEALTLGVVNSRASVEAHKALAAVQPLPLPKDYPA
jgi:hypothetical protein